MNIFHLTALVLGSAYFFPVSCTTSMIAGAHILANLEARDVSKGKMPHQQAYLIATLPNTSLKAFPLSEIAEYENKNSQASFLLPTNSGEFSVGEHGKISFVVTAAKPEAQTIEVTFHDDTDTFFRYEASRNTIKPLYTKLWYHGYMFGAIPYALAIAFALHFIGLAMRRKIKNAPKA
jgi:hypothetical protein